MPLMSYSNRSKLSNSLVDAPQLVNAGGAVGRPILSSTLRVVRSAEHRSGIRAGYHLGATAARGGDRKALDSRADAC